MGHERKTTSASYRLIQRFPVVDASATKENAYDYSRVLVQPLMAEESNKPEPLDHEKPSNSVIHFQGTSWELSLTGNVTRSWKWFQNHKPKKDYFQVRHGEKLENWHRFYLYDLKKP